MTFKASSNRASLVLEGDAEDGSSPPRYTSAEVEDDRPRETPSIVATIRRAGQHERLAESDVGQFLGMTSLD